MARSRAKAWVGPPGSGSGWTPTASGPPGTMAQYGSSVHEVYLGLGSWSYLTSSWQEAESNALLSSLYTDRGVFGDNDFSEDNAECRVLRA